MTASVVTVIERAKVDAINREYRLCQGASNDAVAHAVECGRMLAAVKADLDRGDWLPWLADHFEASADTAQLYMRMAENPERVPVFGSVRDAKKQLAKPRAVSPRDAIGMVGALEDDDTPSPSQLPARIDQARDRLRGPAEVVWTDQHSRRRQRIIDMLDEARGQLDHASDDGLNPHARAEMLRTAAIKARQAEGQLGELAFTFER